MKYYTKEWCQNTSQLMIPMPIEVIPKADTFSEEFYQALVKKRLQDECGSGKKDEEAFWRIYEFYLKSLNDHLPISIRQQVADIRVLALRVTTKEIKRKLEKLYRMKRAEQERPFHEYHRVYKKISKRIKKYVNFDVDYMNFHDSTVLSTHFENNDFIIELEGDYMPPEWLRLVFKNAKIIKHESDYLAAWWLDDEIYLTDDEIELHVLMRAKISDNDDVQLELRELILQGSFMELTATPKVIV